MIHSGESHNHSSLAKISEPQNLSDDWQESSFDTTLFPNLDYLDFHRRKIADHMLTSDKFGFFGYSPSFTEEMKKVELESPDVLFFTMNSAIPLADAVRGWKEVFGTNTPELAPILANRAIAYDNDFTSDTIYSLTRSISDWKAMSGIDAASLDSDAHQLNDAAENYYGSDYSIFDLSAEQVLRDDTERRNHDRTAIKERYSRLRREIADAEVERLEKRYMGCKAMIFDQFTFTGKTLTAAESLLTNAGVEVAGGTKGARWYEQYQNFDPNQYIDYQNMTTEYREFMLQIGRAAAQDSLYEQPDEIM